MEPPANPFKRAILAGRQQIGLWVSLGNAYTTEIVAGSGFDMEWGTIFSAVGMDAAILARETERLAAKFR